MNPDRFSDQTHQALVSAQLNATQQKHQFLMPVHVLNSLLTDSTPPKAQKKDKNAPKPAWISDILTQAGADVAQIRKQTTAELKKLPQVDGPGVGTLNASRELLAVIQSANTITEEAGDEVITSERMIQAMLTLPDPVTAPILEGAGLNSGALASTILSVRKGRKATGKNAEDQFDMLAKYATDLTEIARAGKLDPIIGRDEEIRRTVQILSRRTKNNPVLIGEPGVGKTAIVEGLAQRILKGDVPESLIGKKLLSLDLGALVAGAKFRGEFEERLKGVLDEIRAAEGGLVIFIDEMHTLMGAGKGESGAMDASNMLKPALARGELHMIGATTLDEYRQYVEKDAAFTRRFQPVYVNEPTITDTISILRGIKEKYDLHHGVRLSDAALVAAATLSDRYITDRFLPDKAIDLIDEASARLRMTIDSKPEELDELDRRIVQLRIEREALKKETDKNSQTRLKDLEKDLKKLEKQSSDMSEVWQGEKEQVTELKTLNERLDSKRAALDEAQRQGDWERAGQLTHSEIPELEQKIASLQATTEAETTHARRDVTDQDIAAIVSRWTGVPVEKMLEGERDKLLKMEDELSKNVIGQHQAVTAVSNAIRRARAGLADPDRPIGAFLFLGPTGVGKTELTKALAQFMFNDSNALLRIDMSEYMEKHSVARLIGAPPGYVGYESGGSLTEAVRRRPYQVVLFDEVEKAHPDVFNVLLQVFDDGRLTDGQGRTVDFRNTILIMTSNLGAEHLITLADDADVDTARDAVMGEVKQAFRPEFINRLDDILLFQKLSLAQLVPIVRLQLDRLRERLRSQSITLRVSEAAEKHLAEQGYDPVFGARPLKRVIQNQVQNPLSEQILSGDLTPHSTVELDIANNRLVFSKN